MNQEKIKKDSKEEKTVAYHLSEADILFKTVMNVPYTEYREKKKEQADNNNICSVSGEKCFCFSFANQMKECECPSGLFKKVKRNDTEKEAYQKELVIETTKKDKKKNNRED